MHPAIRQTFAEIIPDAAYRISLLKAAGAAYSDPARHYHNLVHLDHLTDELQQVRAAVADWNLLMLAAAYHDLVYDTGRSDNEERSAARAVSELQPFLDPAQLHRLQEIILATKHHEPAADNDTNLFCDADLAILGAAPDAYDVYAARIRQEYGRFPDALYGPGRCGVLQQLLGQPALFKTALFRERYEAAARANMRRELDALRAGGTI